MAFPKTEQELQNFIQAQLDASPIVANLRNSTSRAPTYTAATVPSAAKLGPGAIVYVSDAPAGSKFQGSDGSVMIALG